MVVSCDGWAVQVPSSFPSLARRRSGGVGCGDGSARRDGARIRPAGSRSAGWPGLRKASSLRLLELLEELGRELVLRLERDDRLELVGRLVVWPWVR